MSANPDNLVSMPVKVPPDTPRRREALWIKEGRKCHWCGCPTRLCSEQVDDQATIEHIVPRYKGGTNEDDNLTSACRKCNSRRSYEDSRNMKEGALLGKWPMDKSTRRVNKIVQKPEYNYPKHIALTRDEKKALFSSLDATKNEKDAAKLIEAHMKTIDVVKTQRDQALTEIASLRMKLGQLDVTVKAQEEELKSMTVAKLLKKKLLRWLST